VCRPPRRAGTLGWRVEEAMLTRKGTAVLALCLMCLPAVAFAQTSPEAETAGWIIAVSTLVGAVVLLLIALGLARIAEGSAMAENISYVVAGCVCLACSVLATWIVRFTRGTFLGEQLMLTSEALIVACIAFFCVYFFRVRAALKRFRKTTAEAYALVASQMPDPVDEPLDEAEADEEAAADHDA
jgi:hypothetical protein